ncbi:MAG: hypothetical protein P1U53_01180 [Sulfitobacter sp.]|nr:hypothetical protein [Sulfitobacter sp.]
MAAMKSFGEYLTEKESLDEGVVRVTAISSFAAKSRAHGREAEQSFKRGLRDLSAPTKNMSTEQRLDRLDDALTAILVGLISTRHQIGSGVAVDAGGHLLTAKALSDKSRKRR